MTLDERDPDLEQLFAATETAPADGAFVARVRADVARARSRDRAILWTAGLTAAAMAIALTPTLLAGATYVAELPAQLFTEPSASFMVSPIGLVLSGVVGGLAITRVAWRRAF
jgi:hypothetical protein